MASQSKVKAGHAYILVEALDKTSAVFGSITRKLDAISQRFLFTARQASILGAALSIPLISSVNSARDFSDEILFLQSILGATDDAMSPLIDKIKELGRTTSFTATEVATAATALAQGGFTIDKIRGSLKATLDMARGARMDLGRAANILVDTLTLFNMEASEASVVADKFFVAAKNGTIDVADLAQSFSYTALSAAEMGFNLDETLSILSEMSKRMLKSTKAGTSLNQFITSLASNIEKIRDPEKLGIDIFSGGEPKPALQIIKEFADVVNAMPTEKRLPIIEEIFNVRGARAATSIARSLEGIFKSVDEMGDSADAAATASANMDSGIGGSIRRILSSINLLKIEVGLAMEEILQDTENTVIPIVRGMSIWAQSNQDAIRDVVKIVGAVVGFAAVMTTLGISTRIAAIALTGIASLVRITTLPVRILSKTVGLLTTLSIRLVKAGLNLIIRTLSLFVRVITLPIELVFRLARAFIFATTASIRFAVSLFQSVVRAGTSVISTFTSFIGLIVDTANALFMASARVLNFSLTLTENLGSSLVRVGRLLFDFGLILINSLGTWIGAVNNLFATFVIGITGMLSTAIGVITALIGQALVFAGPILALGVLIGIFFAIGAAIGVIREHITRLYDAAQRIVTSLTKISGHIVELANTTIRFVTFLVRNSLPSLQEFIGKVFNAVVTSGKAMWEDLVFTVNSSMAKMKSLIERGDLEGAFRLAMSGLKFMWESTIIEMQILWKKFSTEGTILFRNLTMEATIAWMKFKSQFSASVTEIHTELQNIVDALTQVFSVLYNSISRTASLIGGPAVSLMADIIGDLLAELNEESKNLFMEIRRSQLLEAERKRLLGPTAEEMEIDRQIALMREASKVVDAEARALLEEQIKRLEAAKEALRKEFLIAASEAPDITEEQAEEIRKGTKEKKAKPTLPPLDFPSDIMQDIAKTNASLPEALIKGSLAAEEKSAQNRQTTLLSKISDTLISIDKRIGRDSPPLPGAEPVGV